MRATPRWQRFCLNLNSGKTTETGAKYANPFIVVERPEEAGAENAHQDSVPAKLA
jgi:hypothetical protein